MESRGKADFRAAREQVGMSRALVAQELGVTERTVRRWEDPQFSPPPPEAWRFIDNRTNAQAALINAAISKAPKPSELIEIRINYYRSQNQYDRYGRDKGDYNIANANARATAAALKQRGYRVSFAYPDEDGYTATLGNDQM